VAWQEWSDRDDEDSRFTTTHWTAIFSACTSGQPGQSEALGHLLGKYWRPVYCYLRRRGHDSEEAADLVQGFFHEAILRRGLLRSASPENGRFRTLLLKALDRYCSNVRRHREARKRRPVGGWIRLDAREAQCLADGNPEADPERAFHYAWASQLLDEVLSAVEAECNTEGKLVHWNLFRERVLEPILSEAARPALPALCERYRVADQAKASNMIITVKRRIQKEMARRLRQMVGSDADVAREIHDLREILSRNSAGPPVGW